MAWNDLSLSDKARMMQLAVRSGITDLRTIEEVYNKYAEGGNLFGEGGPEDRQKMYNSVKNRIIQQAQAEQKATQTKMGEQPLEEKHPGLTVGIMAAQPGTIIEKALAPMIYKDMAQSISEGNLSESLMSAMAPVKVKGLLPTQQVVKDMNGFVRKGSQFRIVDKPAIEDAVESRVIRSKTGLYHGVPEYLRENFSEYLEKIPGWEKMDAGDIKAKLKELGAFSNMSENEALTAKFNIRNSTNHGGTVGYFKDTPYPNYEISPNNYIIETPSSSQHFAPGHHGTIFDWPLESRKTGATVLIDKNGVATGASIPVDGSVYWEFSPEMGGWITKNFKYGGNLFAKGGKYLLSRYEDRPDATFEETLMVRPPEIIKQENTPKYVEKERKQYTVQTGDSLSKIASKNNVPLDSLLSFNPQIKNPNVIHTGDNIYLERQEFEKPKEIKDIRETRQLESQLSSKEAIMAATHKSNYAIIDKDAQKIEVYNPQGELLGKVDTITGQSNLDYNTKTYTDSRGELIDMQGNNSTPAGITEITSTGSYHGVPSFQRSRVGNDDKVKKTKAGEADTIASALHFEYGVGTGKNRSNGCVRLSTEGAQALGQMLGVGDRIYTLPQQEGSRFVLRDGKLSFIADNVFGKDETSADTTKVNGQIKSKADWDDYNVTVNRTYSPLKIVTQQTGEKEYDSNVKTFSTSLENNKENLMKNLGLSSYEYNTLAMLAMGIAQQESKFGTSMMYKLKNLGVTIGNKDINVQKAVKDIVGNNSYDSQGIGQIKYKGDNEDAQKMYKKAGVTENHDDISNEAKGIVARLAHIYKNQYLGKSKLFESAGISTEEALAFLYNGGKVSEIKNAVENNENIRDLVHSVPDGVMGRITGKTKLVSTLDYANKVLSNMNKFKFLGEY